MKLPGESVLVRLIETVERGVGGLCAPWQTRRVEAARSDARIIERLRLVRVEQDIAAIRAGEKGVDEQGRLVENGASKTLMLEAPKSNTGNNESAERRISQSFSDASRERFTADEMQRSVNLKRIVMFAEEEAEQTDEPLGKDAGAKQPKEEVDEDWFAKWRQGAQDVRREEMQRLWGKLLTAEVTEPGTYSLHTVDFLSRMSHSDAELLARIAPFQTNGGLIQLDKKFYPSQGMDLTTL